jgi:autotransporter-associated beta strand protein
MGGGTIAQAVALNAPLNLSNQGGGTFSGIISDGSSGPMGVSSLPVVSAGTLVLQGNNAFSGAFFSQPRGTITANTTLSGANGAMHASSYTLTDSQVLLLDNTAALNSNRLNGSPIALNRAVLQLNGNSNNSVTQSVGAITFTGGASLMANPVVTGVANTTLDAASLSRSNRGTLTVQTLANLTTGVGGHIKSDADLSGDLAGGGGAAGSTNISILPYAFGISADVSTPASKGGQLMTWDSGTGFVRPLVAAEYASTYQNQGSSSTNNLRSTNTVIGGNTQANAVVLDTPMVASAGATTGSGLYMKPGSVLSPASGVLLSSISNTSSTSVLQTSTIPSIVAGGTLNFDGHEAIIHTLNNTAIESTISGSQGLTKGGSGGLVLAAGNTFTGPVTVNMGGLYIDSDSALGNAGNSVTLACGNSAGGVTENSIGGGSSGLVFAPSVLLGTSMQQSFTTNRSINLLGAGGGIIVPVTSTQVTASGIISGSGTFYANVPGGLLKLTGANTYSGPTVISGNLAIDSDANFGNSSELNLAGGSLRNDGVLDTSRNIVVTGSTPLITNADATLRGTIVGISGTLTKAGPGTLTITANSPFNGGFSVGQTSTLVGGQTGWVPGGTLVLSGNGALPSCTTSTVNAGAALTLDNTGTNLSNRFSATLSLSGGTFNFLGNSSADSSETLGSLGLTASGTSGQNVVNLVPGTGHSAAVTVTSITRTTNLANGNATLLVRGGPGLGGTGPGSTNLLVTDVAGGSALTSPNFVNGCVGGVVVDTSSDPSGPGTDLANYVAGQGIVAATYPGGNALASASMNSDLTSNQVLAAPGLANSIRISEGGGIDLAGQGLTISGPGTILAVGPSPKTITNSGSGGQITFPVSAAIWNNCDLTVNATLTGMQTLSKSGPGTLFLNTPLSASSLGTVSVANGTLKLGAANVIPTSAQMDVGPSGTLDLNGQNAAFTQLNGMGTVANSNNLTVAGGTFEGTINGAGTVTVYSGTTANANWGVLGKTSTYTGDTIVKTWPTGTSGGQLTIGANQDDGPGPLGMGSASGGGNIVVGDPTPGSAISGIVTVQAQVSHINKNFVYPATTSATQIPAFNTQPGNNVTINGTVTMSRTVALSGSTQNSNSFPFVGRSVTYTQTIMDGTAPGTYEWSGGSCNLMAANTFSGGINAHPGSADPETCFLGIGNNSALGTGSIRVTNTDGGSLQALNGPKTISNDVYWTFNSISRFGFSGTNDLTLNGQMDLGGGAFAAANPPSVGTGNRAFNVINSGTTTIAGTISGISTATLTKNGDGRLVMSGTNTFAGNVTLNAGTLLVNGSNGGAGAYTVNANAILGGTGSITGPVSVAAGGIIEPGDSPGTLSTGNLNLVAGSVMTYELDTPNTVGGGVNDLVAINGNLNLPASGVVVNIVGLPSFTLVPGNTYTLMTYTGTLTGSAASFQLGFAPASVTGATFDTTSQPGAVLITVVPTPGSFGLLGMAGLLAARRRRR